MSGWVAIETDLWRRPAFRRLSVCARLLFFAGRCYCSEQMTDGVIAADALELVAVDARVPVAEAPTLARELVGGELWAAHEEGWLDVAYLTYNPSREQRERGREKSRARIQKYRERQRRNGVTNGVRNGSRETGERQERREQDLQPPADERPDVVALCDELVRLIGETMPPGRRRPVVSREWRDAARLLLDRDRVPADEAMEVMRWTFADDFWSDKVLSLPTFRRQYEKLRRAATKGSNPRPAPSASSYSAKYAGRPVTVLNTEVS